MGSAGGLVWGGSVLLCCATLLTNGLKRQIITCLTQALLPVFNVFCILFLLMGICTYETPCGRRLAAVVLMPVESTGEP